MKKALSRDNPTSGLVIPLLLWRHAALARGKPDVGIVQGLPVRAGGDVEGAVRIDDPKSFGVLGDGSKDCLRGEQTMVPRVVDDEVAARP